MEYLILAIIILIIVIILKFIFEYKLKNLKELGKDEELDKLADKYPENIDMCKSYLKMLNNDTVEIEENKDSQTSLYIAVTNKISIANVRNTYTRIQTIAHECLHSVQDRKLLMFNFWFSNVYLLYFLIISILEIFNVLPYKMMFLVIFILLSFVYYMVRAFLENDAMIKAKYLAKDYMENMKISTKEEIEKIVSGFDKINNKGIKCINYNLFLGCMIKILIFLILCIF